MLYLASLDTINFRFQALGATEQEALGILALAWEEHARQSGAYVTWDDLADDANVTALQLGHGYRDGSDIVEADTTSSASRQTFIDTGAYLPTGAAGTDETWNTSPAESPDLSCVIDPSDLAALTAGRRIHVEAWQPEGFGAPAAIVRVSYDPHA